jgi:hypothetical protein
MTAAAAGIVVASPPLADSDWPAVIDGCRDLMATAFGTNSSMDDAFDLACREADRRAASRPEDPRIRRARRLLADDVSYEHAYAEFMRDRPTPEAAIDALVYVLRRGVVELTKADVLRRLSDLDQSGLEAVCLRVQAFKPNIAEPWSADDVALLVSAWRKFHEHR